MNVENSNQDDDYKLTEDISQKNKSSNDYELERHNFDERALAFKENQSNSTTTSIFELGCDELKESKPFTKSHHSKVLYTNQKFSDVNKCQMKYFNKGIDGADAACNTPNQLSSNAIDHEECISEINPKLIETSDEIFSTNTKNFIKSSAHENKNSFVDIQKTNLQQNDLLIDKIENAIPEFSDHFSAEGLSFTAKNRSELIFLYLTHKDIKNRIDDLELRENRAAIKGLWENALRLRDMKNRLELMREREIYQREDLQLDSEVRQLVMNSIGKRTQLLEKRKTLYTDAWLYSEDAKIAYDKWVMEDKNTIIIDGYDQRKNLLQQLEEEWCRLPESDKQRIKQIYNNVMTGSSMQNELQLIASNIPH